MALARALRRPLRTLLSNAGFEPSPIVAQLVSPQAFDVRDGCAVDAWASGLLDPLPPLRDSLQKAASLARLVIGTEVAVLEDEGGPASARSSGTRE
jgi:chaperonin GroEL